jgi:uncharacterized integral membrane protein
LLPWADERDASASGSERGLMSERNERPFQEGRREPVFEGTGIYGAVVAGFAVGLALVLLIAQNTHEVDVSWFVWDFAVPLAAMILGIGLLASALTVAIGVVWRRRRRRVLTERRELERLRADSVGGDPAADPRQRRDPRTHGRSDGSPPSGD